MVIDNRVADQGLVSDLDVRRVAEAKTAARLIHRHLPELGRVREPLEHVADLQALLRALDEPAGAGRGRLQEGQRRHDLRVAGGLHHLIELNAALAQPLGIDLHLNLLIAHAPDRHSLVALLWRRGRQSEATGVS